MTNPVIEFKNVSKSFHYWENRPDSIKKILSDFLKNKVDLGRTRQVDILKNVSFKVHPGEFVGIMGKNGAGKSTLLKVITGIYIPNKGEVIVSGKVAPLLELGAGFSDELSGYENIFLNAAVLEFGRKQIQEKIQMIIDFSDLKEHIYKPVRTYSSGMLIRLGFSVAVHLDAPIFLFDEILAVGDVGFQKKCLDKIHEMYKNGKSIILVTHNPEQVEKFCNRCILIDDKTVVFDGDPHEGTRLYKDLFK
jgi:ABC-type polysaccharide/polyol phosphate transport system ATPase subunit